MLDFLPSIAARIRVPRLAWRGGTGAARAGIESAAEIVRHEQAQGRLLDLTPSFVSFLEGFAAAALLWVTFNRANAARYGPPLRVEIDRRAFIIGEDGAGGFLLLFHDAKADDDTMPQQGLSEMKAPAEATEREMKEAAALYLASSDKPANQNSEGKPMTAIETKAELAADRATDLDKRIGLLESDTFAIPGKGDEFAQRAQDFRAEQAQLSGDEKEAHGHDYAAGLACDLAAYKESAGSHDAAAMLTKEAEGRLEIAGMLRGDSDQPTKAAELSPSQPSEAGRAVDQYDALRQSHRDVDDEEAKKAANGPAYGEEPTRPTHIRATLAAEPAPDGTKSTRSTYLDPNENPSLPAQIEAATEPRPMHPDDHAAKIEATASEQFAADMADIRAQPEPADTGREVAHIQGEAESISRQEGERRAAAGEAPEPGKLAPAKEATAADRFAADMADLRAQPDAEGNEQAPTLTRGLGD